MSQVRRRKRSLSHSGSSLLETLLAILLGTVLIIAAWQSLGQITTAQQFLDAQNQASLEGRYAMALMRQHIALAGYTAWEQAALRNTPIPQKLQGDAHSIRVQYHNVRRDCLSERSSGAVNDMRFYVAMADVNQLYCQSQLDSGTQTQPIARGVEELVLRYWVAGQWQSQVDTVSPAVDAVEICLILAATDYPLMHHSAWQTQRPSCARTHAQGHSSAYVPDLPRAPGDRRRWLRLSTLVATPNARHIPWPTP